MVNSSEKPKKKKWKTDPETLAKAVQQVQIGKMSVCKASEVFGIAKTTISDHVMGKRVCTKNGPELYISQHLEDRIAAWLTKMARIGYGQTKEQLFDKVQELVIHLNITTPFKNNRPTKMWYRLFMTCYPDLAHKQPLLLSKQWASVTKEHLYEWFDDLKKYMEESGHGYILDLPECIFNADETGSNKNVGKRCTTRGVASFALLSGRYPLSSLVGYQLVQRDYPLSCPGWGYPSPWSTWNRTLDRSTPLERTWGHTWDHRQGYPPPHCGQTVILRKRAITKSVFRQGLQECADPLGATIL